jgi:hypothetical protein
MEDDMYIYVFNPTIKKAKLFKKEVKWDRWEKFLDMLFDEGMQVTASDENTFKNSNGKHRLMDSTYNSLYEKPF